MIPFRNFFRLTNYEQYLCFKVLFLLTYFRIRLKTTPLRTLLQEVEDVTSRPTSLNTTQHSITPGKLAKIVSFANHLLPFSTCLSQALVGKKLFTEHGHKAEIHIGIPPNIRDEFEAHAWLSHNGKILLGNLYNLNEYKEFPMSIPPRKEI